MRMFLAILLVASLTGGAIYYAYDRDQAAKGWEKSYTKAQQDAARSASRAKSYQALAETNKKRSGEINALMASQTQELNTLRTRLQKLVGDKAQAEDAQLLSQAASDELAGVTLKLNDCIAGLTEVISKKDDKIWIDANQTQINDLCSVARKDLDAYVARYG